ncbi:MAG: porin [Pseudomonadota bacterium]
MQHATPLLRPPFARPRLAGLAALACLMASQAQASATLNFGEDQSLSLGLGLRTSFTHTNTGNNKNDFNLDSIRLYANASLNKYIKGTFNTEKDSDDNVKVLDAIARFEFSDGFNIWAGRMLPPSDRANLDGPYYLSAWSYPGVVSQYPARFAGRDDGLTVWGKVADQKLVYAVGAFRGHNRVSGASNDDGGNLLYAGRIQYNFRDAEPNPAYYASSTYHGGAEVLALGLAGMYQADGVGTAATQGDYTGLSVDALMEHKLQGGGVVNLEAAYYDFDTDDVADVAAGFGGAGATDNVGGISQGDGWLVGAAYLIPAQVGWGKFQPYARYQTFDNDLANTTTKQTDVGVNYVIKGHNARVSMNYGKAKVTATPDVKTFTVGLQVQF